MISDATHIYVDGDRSAILSTNQSDVATVTSTTSATNSLIPGEANGFDSNAVLNGITDQNTISGAGVGHSEKLPVHDTGVPGKWTNVKGRRMKNGQDIINSLMDNSAETLTKATSGPGASTSTTL